MPYPKIYNKKENLNNKTIYNINCYEDISNFYDEVQHILCDDWKYFGRNLDALYDIVVNGYTGYTGETEINLINSKYLTPKIKKVFTDAVENNNLLSVNFL
jgi:RNAse (barnase) inhibitor barstar